MGNDLSKHGEQRFLVDRLALLERDRPSRSILVTGRDDAGWIGDAEVRVQGPQPLVLATDQRVLQPV